MNRRLYRCRHDKRLAGVASGMAEYFEIDPSLVRVLWVISVFFGGVGILLYLAMVVIVPLEPEVGFTAAGAAGDPVATAEGDPTVTADGHPATAPAGWHSMPAEHRHVSHGSGRATTIFGVILILFGALALVHTFLPAWAESGRVLWPAFIVGLGAILVLTGVRREPNAS
jgi:phage shock protein C